MKKQLLILAMILLPMVASAYDFKYNGIAYTFVSQTEQTIEVASSNQSAGSDGPVSYSGDIIIPSIVTYGGKEYTVIGIGEAAFVNCVSINSVSLPNTLTYIRKEAFNLCVSLKKIVIPQNVNSIGSNIFWGASISEITVLNPIPPTADYNAFSYQQNYCNCVLYVPYGSLNSYQNAYEWKKFNQIIELEKEKDNINGHEYVDLGLPSGKCWATTNYGANAPEDYGIYLEWNNYSTVSLTWGDEWVTPSLEDIRELENQCSWTWSSKNGHEGFMVTGPNGNNIFLPACGFKMIGQNSIQRVGEWVYYWTSTCSGEMASIILSTSSNVWFGEMNTMFTMLPIRPITREKQSSGDEEPEEPKKYVDLGLPSGLLWATTNVGANHPEEYGSYFAWGETSPKSTYNWSTYKYANGSETTLTKYCSSSNYGNVDYKESLDEEDDAATVNWGKPWRTPTLSETQELISYCSWNYTSLNGTYGYNVTGPNGNSIFLPSAGVIQHDFAYMMGTGACIQSSTIFNASNGKPSSASVLLCEDGNPHWWYGWSRCWGYPVRPVTSKDPSGIITPSVDDSQEIISIYNVQGHKIEHYQKGLNIIQYKNGTTKKIVVQ